MDGADDFGPVRSAVWFEIDADADIKHSFALLSAKSACSAAQALLPEAAFEEAELALKIEPLAGDIDAQCPIYRNHYNRMAELTDPLFADGMHAVSLVLRDPDKDPKDAPAEGTYTHFTPDIDTSYFLGAVTYYAESPYRIRAESFDCGANAKEIQDQVDNAVSSWFLADGEAEARVLGSGSYRIAVDAALEDADGERVGSMTAQGKFEHCEMELSGHTSISL